MSQIKLLTVFPFSGNGGIQSWANNYYKNLIDNEYHLTKVNNSPLDRKGKNGIFVRVWTGSVALFRVIKDICRNIKKENTDILHATTSGNIGTIRDYIIGTICKRHNVRSILHCHYGCISDDLSKEGRLAKLLKSTFKIYDQIWVLDKRSFDTLNEDPDLKGKIFLTPNSIDVNKPYDNRPYSYNNIAFIGNLIPSKGIFELIEAANKTGIRLDIIGPGEESVIEEIKKLAGSNFDKSIFLHGKLPNDKAVEFLKQVDMIALPTYFPSEAFPMSILEAMANSKLVISCPRAAIPDMLTDLEGNNCGILVKEKSSYEIANAIKWCQANPRLADEMRKKAYVKVKASYDMNIVYDIYRENYNLLLTAE